MMARQGKKEPEQPTHTPPANPEAEQSILGSILIRPEVMDEIAEILTPADFYREAHGKIFTCMLGLYNQGEPIDLVTVTGRLRDYGLLEASGGPVFLAELSEQVGFATNGVFYARKVRDLAQLRRLLDVSQEIAGGCFGKVENVQEFIEQAEEKVFAIQDQQDAQIAYTLAEVVPGEIERLEAIFSRKKEILGVPSGLLDLDNLTCGWQKGDLVIVGARPSMGKTALALNNFSYHAAAVAKVPVAFFSMEQPKEQLVQRQLAAVGQINSYRLRSARLDSDGWARLQTAAGELLDLPLHIIDKPGLTPLAIRSQVRRLKARQNIGLVIIDYLQLAKYKGAKSREQEISMISQGLKGIAKEMNLPVIALCQLNRKVEERPNKRPMLSDLRESGSLEQDADMVVLLYREEVYKGKDCPEAGTAEINLAKNRNGPIGKVKAVYQKEIMLFRDYQEI